MSVLQIQTAELPKGDFEPMPIEPSWVIEGNPTARGMVLLQSADKKVSCGAWECTAGKFQWIFGWDEFVQIQEGEAQIRDETGRTVTLRRGDLAFFPVGMKTFWHVPNYVRKVFTVRTAEPLG